MDILISSNLERLIFELTGRNPEKCASFMRALSENGSYEVSPEMRENLDIFYAGCAGEEENFRGIADLYAKTGYVIDTHTGIGHAVYEQYKKETGDQTPAVIASTASPYKFAGSVVAAIDPDYKVKNSFEDIDALVMLSDVPEPEAVRRIRTAQIRHDRITSPEQLSEEVADILGI